MLTFGPIPLLYDNNRSGDTKSIMLVLIEATLHAFLQQIFLMEISSFLIMHYEILFIIFCLDFKHYVSESKKHCQLLHPTF